MSLRHTSVKYLLAGTALVAISLGAGLARADDLGDLDNDATWASEGGADSSDVANAAAGDDLNLAGHVLTVTNDGDADDGSANTDTFQLGAITNDDTGGALNIVQSEGQGGNFSVTVDSIVDGTGGTTSVVIQNVDDDPGRDMAVHVDKSVNIDGDLTVVNKQGTEAHTVAATFNESSGTTKIGGATHVTAGDADNATATLTAMGGATFTGAVTVAGGAGAGADATLEIKHDADFDGGLTLSGVEDGGNGILLVNGVTAQDISGVINGANGTGLLKSNAGANAVTFADNIGGASAATTLGAIELDGTGGTTFEGTVRAGTITSDHATGTDTFEQNVTATALDIANAGTVLLEGADNAIATTTFNDDGTLELGDGAKLTGAVENAGASGAGAILFDGAGEITGAVGSSAKLVRVIDTAATGDARIGGNVFAVDINLNGAGTTTFGGTVTATNITFNDAGAVVFNGNVASSGGASFNNFDGTMTLGTGAGFNGAIDNNTADGKGTLILAGGAQTVSGQIGGTNALKEVKAGQTAGAISTFGGLVNAQDFTVGPGTARLNAGASADIDFADDGTVEIADGQALTGDVTTSAPGTGTLNIKGVLNMTGDIGTGGQLKALTLSNSSGLSANVDGSVVAAKTTTLGRNDLVISGDYTQGAGDTLNTTVNGDADFGAVTVTGDATVAEGSTVKVDFTAAYTSPLAEGTTKHFAIVTGAGGGSDVEAVNLSGGALWTLTQTDTGTGNLEFDAVRHSEVTLASNANNKAAAVALKAAVSLPSGAGLQPVYAKVLEADTLQELNDTLEAIQPTVDGSAQFQALAVGSHVQALEETRLAAVRNGDGLAGMAAGSERDGASLWMQGFGSTATQDARGGIKGYDANVYGGMIGYDSTEVLEDGAIGIAASYGVADADSDNANTTSTSINSYGVSLYGMSRLPKSLFVEGSVGYAYNDLYIKRHATGGPGTTTYARAGTHTDQYSAALALGGDYRVGLGTTLTPRLSANYVTLRSPGYQETGNGPTLKVDDSTFDNLDLGFDLQAGWKIKDIDDNQIHPTVHFGYSYGAIADKVSNNAHFAGVNGPIFKVEGPDPDRSTFDTGLGVVFYPVSAWWDLSAAYNYTFRSSYDEHAGTLRVSSRF